MWSFKVDRLEEQIDIYWKQRAHVNWLRFGDRNTNFFHNACSSRRRRNRIGRLMKGDGSWDAALACGCPALCIGGNE